MLTIGSLFAALTIAGAFWVGLLAARRLRDWGEGRRLAEATAPMLALGRGAGDDGDGAGRAGARARIREYVAAHLEAEIGAHGGPRPLEDGLGPERLRVDDVVSLDRLCGPDGGDWIVAGVVGLREGAAARIVASVRDGARERWLVAGPDDAKLWWLTPVVDHDLRGEPPRVLEYGGRIYTLHQRSQASVALLGQTGRPSEPRVALYRYESPDGAVAWVERWDQRVFVGLGEAHDASMVSYLPGS